MAIASRLRTVAPPPKATRATKIATTTMCWTSGG